MPELAGEESAGRRLRFAWVAVAVFAALTVPRLLAHELWRDEAWLWLVVDDSSSLVDLSARLGRTGQGYLFPWLCFFARALSASPLALQALHLVLAAAGVFAFARWAPFGRSARALFVLGYFPFYEYAVLSRHYVLGMLLVWVACAAWSTRRAVVVLGVVCALLCQTTVYGFILAVALAAGFAADRFGRRAAASRPPTGELVLGAALAVGGGVAGLVQLMPEPGTVFAPGWRFGWDAALAARVAATPWRAFVPLPRPSIQFWNTNLLDSWPALETALGPLVLAGAIAFLRPRRAALVTFLVGALGLLTFGYVKLVGSARHDGHWWVLFVAALWIGGIPAAARRRGWRATAFGAFLFVHCVAGAYASWVDLRRPFSNADAAARLLHGGGLDREPILAYREPPAAPVALALGAPLYFPSRGVFARYPDWGPGQRELTPEELRCAARDFAARSGRDAVLVLNRELPPWPEVEAAGAALGAIEPSEDYRLYRLSFGRLSATAAEARCPAAPRP